MVCGEVSNGIGFQRKGYKASYKACVPLYDKVFKEIKLVELQNVVDTCGKNYPTLRKLKVLLNQLYEYAMKNELCNKDYSEYVDIVKHKGRNPNKRDREKFTKAEIDRLWKASDDKYYQIVLIFDLFGCEDFRNTESKTRRCKPERTIF